MYVYHYFRDDEEIKVATDYSEVTDSYSLEVTSTNSEGHIGMNLNKKQLLKIYNKLKVYVENNIYNKGVKTNGSGKECMVAVTAQTKLPITNIAQMREFLHSMTAEEIGLFRNL